MGMTGRQTLRVPIYLVAMIPFDLFALVGMYWALLRPQAGPRRPL
jgi:hypothetical protein